MVAPYSKRDGKYYRGDQEISEAEFMADLDGPMAPDEDDEEPSPMPMEDGQDDEPVGR